MKKAAALAAFLAAAIALPPTGAHAVSLYFSTFGPSQSFEQVGGLVATGPSSAPYSLYVANAFPVPGFGFFLHHIDIAVAYNGCLALEDTGLSIDLVGDSGGAPDATNVLAHWYVAKVPSSCKGTAITPVRLNANASTELPGGTTYWIVATPVGLYDGVDWFPALTANSSAPSAGSFDGGHSWFPGVSLNVSTLAFDV